MLRHYLAVALRNLAAQKRYAAITIGGLAVGLAACLVILLYVRDERSYEAWIPNADRIVNYETTIRVPGAETMSFAGSAGPLKAALDKELSSEIERTVRVYKEPAPVKIDDRVLRAEIAYVDPGFFGVFDLPMIAGDREAALRDKSSILVSETTAHAWFGDAPPVGRTVTIDGKYTYTVVGEFADIPRASHLELEAIAYFDTPRWHDEPYVADRWTSANVNTYSLLRAPDAVDDIIARLPALVDRNVVIEVPGFSEKPSQLIEYFPQRLRDIHLHAKVPGYAHVGSFAAVVAFAGIALLILIIACINFVNLATARAMKRAREVGMRKVVGATRGQLIAQHLGEAIVTALIALVIAIALVEVSLGAFNQFLDKSLRLDLTGDPILWLTIAGLVLVVGVAGGLYPAVYLSRFRPAVVLKANQSGQHGSTLLRSGLVVFQFAISITLMICTVVIYAQTVYARRLELGYAPKNRMTLGGLGALAEGKNAATLKREIAALPGVEGVTLSSDTPPLGSDNHTLLYTHPVGEDGRTLIETLRVDPDFFQVYGVTPLAGRLFSADHPSDFFPDDKDPAPKDGVIINRTLMMKLGIADPASAIGRVYWDVTSAEDPLRRAQTTIVGVVPDLYLRSVRDEVTPMMFYVSPPERHFSRLTLKAAPGRMPEVARAAAAVWARLMPELPLRAGYVDDDLAKQYDADAQRGQIFAAFSVLAIVIACLGLFGLAAFSAERRTKEIGMRKVMGASVLDIVRLLVWQFSRPVLIA
ncbi:MAG TPA: ABC transporter permease, partial [Kofleriaceae bacterium]|nr:ABC transporter permease [Kofleriaceae bacterium]